MNFVPAISPPRRKRSESNMEKIRINRSESVSTTIQLIEEINQLMKQQQCSQQLQNQITQLSTYTLELEQKAISLQKNIDQSRQKSFESTPMNTTERRYKKDNSPCRYIKRIDMIGSWKIEPTPRQKFVLRKSTADAEFISQKNTIQEQQKKLHNDAQDIQYLQGLLDLKDQSSKISPSIQKLIQIVQQDSPELQQQAKRVDQLTFHNQIFEPLKFCTEYIHHSQVVLQKLKKLIRFLLDYRSLSPNELFDEFYRITQQLFECERSQIYIYDEKNHYFWTKTLESPKRIIYQFKGLVAYIFKTCNLVNIHDAYQDVRFDVEFDQNTKKTKSLLGAPILSINNTLIGIFVIGHQSLRIFRKEDEILMQTMCEVANVIFSQYISNSYVSPYSDHMQKILQYSLYLSQANDQKHFILLIQEILMKSYQLVQVQVFLKDFIDQKESLLTYSTQQNIKKRISSNCGIVGSVYKTGVSIISESCYKDKFYNKLADIDTHLPTITIPIKQHNDNSSLGVIQYVDTKGVDNLSSKNQQQKPQTISLYEQILQFSIMIAYVNDKFYFQPRFYFSENDKLLQITDALTKQQLKENKQQVSKGRSWKADELRLKSTEDLHKLWYVLLKEKNLLISDGIFNKKIIGVRGRMGKLSQVRVSMARLKGVVGERDTIKRKYRKQLEDEYVEKKKQEYLQQLIEQQKQEIFVPEITPNLLRAKLRHLKRGKDDITYIEEAVAIIQGRKQFNQHLREKYNYKEKKIINADATLPEGVNENDVIRRFKSNVQEQIESGKQISQEEILRSHVKNWNMLTLRQKRVILNFIQAKRARESKVEFMKELDLLGQKIAYDLKNM